MRTCIWGGAVGLHKVEGAPAAGTERSRVRLKAAEDQAIACPLDFRGACNVGGGICSSLRALPQGAHLIGGCAPGRRPLL